VLYHVCEVQDDRVRDSRLEGVLVVVHHGRRRVVFELDEEALLATDQNQGISRRATVVFSEFRQILLSEIDDCL
jgi:hypothetical protein